MADDTMSIIDMISQGEGRGIEFNLALPEDRSKYLKTVIAFANEFGGYIVFGIADDGTIVGIPEDRISKDMETISFELGAFTQPRIPYDVRMLNIDGRLLAVVRVDEGRSKPYSSGMSEDRGAIYMRHGRNTFRASDEEVRDLVLRQEPVGYDRLPYVSNEGLCGLDTEQAERLIGILRVHRMPDAGMGTLASFGLVTKRGDKYVSTRGFELLTTNRDRFLTMCTAYAGDDVGDIYDRQVLDGSIMEQIDGAGKFVSRNIRCAAVIDGMQRRDVYEIPLDAFREVVCNAVAHRSYSIGGNIQVAVFDDRVEVRSPGTLMIRSDELLVGWSVPRNAALCEFLRETSYAEMSGNGFRKIWRLCREAGLPEPSVDDSSGMVIVTLYKKAHGNRPLQKSVRQKPSIISSYETEMLDRISEDPDVTQQELADMLGISKPYVSKLIRHLKDCGLLTRDQSVRKGGWVVLNPGI